MFYILFIEFLWLLTLHPIWMLSLDPMAGLSLFKIQRFSSPYHQTTEQFFPQPVSLQWFSHVALRDLNSVLFSSPDVDSRSSRGVVTQVILGLFKKNYKYSVFMCVQPQMFPSWPCERIRINPSHFGRVFCHRVTHSRLFLFRLVLHLFILFKTTKPHNTAESVFL